MLFIVGYVGEYDLIGEMNWKGVLYVNEIEYVCMVVEQLGFIYCEKMLLMDEVIVVLLKMIWYLDEFVVDFGVVFLYFLGQFVYNEGVLVF